jgi:hypothetical protein
MRPTTPFMKTLRGVMLAYCFFLINCSDTSTRVVKARMNNNAKARQNNTANMPPCSDKVIKVIDERKKIYDDIQELIEDSKSHELDDAQKVALEKLVIDLKAKSNEIYKAIESIKQGGVTAGGCNHVGADNKKIPYVIKDIRLINYQIAKKVEAITKKPNALSEDADQASATTFLENQTYLITSELASTLVEDKLDGRMYILDGKIHDSSSAQDEMKQLKKENKKSFCYLVAVMGSLKAESNLTIASMRSKVASSKLSAESAIVFHGESEEQVVLECHVQNIEEVPTAARSVLGELIILKTNPE